MAEKVESRVLTSGWVAFFGLVETILDKFGWPGALLIYAIYFVEYHATQEQRRAMVDTYFLGHGIELYYPLFSMGIVFILAFLAQRHYYRKKLALVKGELERLGKWKTRHQEQQAGVSLHHSEQAEE